MNHSAEATMTSKGQVTIPISVRKALGLKPGVKLLFTWSNEGTVSIQARKVCVSSIFGLMESEHSVEFGEMNPETGFGAHDFD